MDTPGYILRSKHDTRQTNDKAIYFTTIYSPKTNAYFEKIKPIYQVIKMNVKNKQVQSYQIL